MKLIVVMDPETGATTAFDQDAWQDSLDTWLVEHFPRLYDEYFDELDGDGDHPDADDFTHFLQSHETDNIYVIYDVELER